MNTEVSVVKRVMCMPIRLDTMFDETDVPLVMYF